MLKKLCASLLALFILTSFSIVAYAIPADSGGNTMQPSSSNAQQSSTESAIKGTTTTKGAVTGEPANTSSSAITDKSAKKPVLEDVLKDILKDGTAVKDKYFIMQITNPQMDKESTVYKSYVLSGNSKYDDVIISIAKYNDATGEYEPMTNTDGESSWEIGEYRLFSKEIKLTEGTNKIMMIAYRTSQKDEALRENIQVDCFTISLLKESIFTKAKNTFIRAAGSIGIDINKK